MQRLEIRTVALLTGLATGLGLVLHAVFFVVALAIVLFELGAALLEDTKMAHPRL